MILWRIANRKFKTLDGSGGLYTGGRWHSQGRQVVYTAEHPALSALEVLVHMDLDLEDLQEFVLLEIQAPDDIAMNVFDGDAFDSDLCLSRGNAWLKGGQQALAKVPSALMPKSYNYLINPQHQDADRITVQSEQPFTFDGRLTRAI